jgi:hypothetical protein
VALHFLDHFQLARGGHARMLRPHSRERTPMKKAIPTITLTNGVEMSILGFGVFQMSLIMVVVRHGHDIYVRSRRPESRASKRATRS